MERRRLISNQIRQIEEARLQHFEQAPNDGLHAMVLLLARVIGVGVETADMLVHEVLSRNMRDRRAIARYAGLTGSPDESGRKRRDAHDCIVVRVLGPTAYKVAARLNRARKRAPL